MNFNLLSQNLLLVLCIVLTVIIFYIIIRIIGLITPQKRTKKIALKEKATQRNAIKQLLIILGVSITISFIFKLFVAHETDSGIPAAFILMVLPTIFSLGLFALIIKRQHRLIIIGTIGLVISVLFSCLLINNYYRFYPTLGQVFNKNNTATLTGTQKDISLQFAPLSHASLDKLSIEGSLSSLNKQPTKGKVYSLNIPGTISKFHARTAYVYVPAIYDSPAQIDLPVIVLTTGFPGLPENWLGSGLQNTMDEFAAHHYGITPLIFMVDNSGSLTNDTECVDSSRGNVETYLTEDVPNYIKSNFQVSNDPGHWAIGGLSMGGTCAVMLALRHPDTYHYFLDYGGEMGPEVGTTGKTIATLFGGSKIAWQEHQPEYLLATRTYKKMGGFFGVGSQDERIVTEAANQLSNDTRKAGIETIYETIGGQHTFNVWQEAFKISLPWVSSRIGATECGVACI